MADKTDSAPKADKKDDGLVEMTKDGEVLRVHPTCVDAHKAVGWE